MSWGLLNGLASMALMCCKLWESALTSAVNWGMNEK